MSEASTGFGFRWRDHSRSGSLFKGFGAVLQASLLASLLGLTAVPALPVSAQADKQASAQDLELEARGEASGGRTQTLEELERLALADAKRMALEQAGTAVQSSTLVEDYTLTRDEILTFAEGVVRVLEVRDKRVRFDEVSQTFHVSLSIRAQVQSLDAQELLQRLQLTRQAEGGAQQPLSFGFSLIAWQPVIGGSRGIRIKPASNTAYSRVEIRDGGSLASGNEFQIHITPQQDAYFYLLNVDARGLLFPLLPHPDGQKDHFLKAGQTYVLPGLNQFYQLDASTGTERIYILAARTRQQDIEYLVQRSLQQPDGLALPNMLHASMRLRESSLIAPGQSQQYQISDQLSVPLVEELVKGQTHALRVFSFEHR